MNTSNLIDISVPTQIAGIVIPALFDAPIYDQSRIEETQGLVEALGVELGFTDAVRIRKPNAAKLFGAGQLDLISERLDDCEGNLLVVDCSLSPIQQRNLENTLNVKVMDRTGLILEIFGVRARSAEGRLQVEMARQLYERSRLVRTWTHLERQRGGTGFLAGPGESQLEADRRMLDGRIAKLKSDLEAVRRTRRLQRAGRKRRGAPIVALAGYTNAGKSTLFNSLTHSSVFAADMPFATLDPTARDVELSSGKKISMIDTVGFITDLPTHLIESFRATIEEAIEADLLLHVRDISHPETDRQSSDVNDVLTKLEQDLNADRPPVIEVWNKSDALSDDVLTALKTTADNRDDIVLTSATTGEGLDDLMQMVQDKLFASTREFELKIEPKYGRARSWLHQNCDISNETVDENGNVIIRVQLSVRELNEFAHEHPDLDMNLVILSSKS